MRATSTSTGCPSLGDCQPSCSPECFKAKLRSMQFLLPGPFRAVKGKTDD